MEKKREGREKFIDLKERKKSREREGASKRDKIKPVSIK